MLQGRQHRRQPASTNERGYVDYPTAARATPLLTLPSLTEICSRFRTRIRSQRGRVTPVHASELDASTASRDSFRVPSARSWPSLDGVFVRVLCNYSFRSLLSSSSTSVTFKRTSRRPGHGKVRRIRGELVNDCVNTKGARTHCWVRVRAPSHVSAFSFYHNVRE